MDHLGSLLTAVLTMTTIIAGGFAGSQRATLQNLRDANKDLRERDADRDKREAELLRKATALESDLDALGRMVRNDAEIAALRDQIHDNHVETRGFWQAQTEQGQKIIDALSRLATGGPSSGPTP